MLNLVHKLLGLVRYPRWQVKRGLERVSAAAMADWKPSAKAECWQALDDDPQLRCKVWGWLPGWYMLELGIEHDQPSGVTMVYWHTGKTFSADQRACLPLRQTRLAKRLIYLPLGLRGLRLDPLATPGCFSIHTCRFVWLTPWFAHKRLLHRLNRAHPLYRDMTLQELMASLQQQAKLTSRRWTDYALQAYEETFGHAARNSHYPTWLLKSEALQPIPINQQATHVTGLPLQPLISILLSVHDTNAKYLYACLESVKAQSYGNWELCIADDSACHESTQRTLYALTQGDTRMRVGGCNAEGRGAAAANVALSLATGDFVVCLGAGDELAPDALFHIVQAINTQPAARLLYSDEDKLDEQGERFDPHFKPDWNPDMLLAKNYIANLAAFERTHLLAVGGYREDYEGGHDHDVLLRFTRELSSQQIVHIPRVLYHWRARRRTRQARGMATAAGKRSVEAVVTTCNPPARVKFGPAGNSYRVLWSLPSPPPLVSLLVPTRDGIDILRPCVDALLERTEYTHFELLIIDNQSRCPATLAYLHDVQVRDSRVRVLQWDAPFNYSAINNFGVQNSRGSVIGLVNNDIEPINSDWLSEMVSQVCRREIGCVGAKLYYPDDTIQHGGVILGYGGVAGHAHKHFPRSHAGYYSRLQVVHNLSAVTAACLLVRREVFDAVGGLNEESLTVAFNDVDLCLKVREAGYRNLWTPFAELYHHESVSRGAEDNPVKQARFQSEIDFMRQTWGPQLDNDPAYNPNLTLAYEDFSLR